MTVTDAAPNLRVVKEPLTYERNGKNSFFRDLLARKMGLDPEAESRLQQHAREMVVEQRVAPGLGAGAGGEFAPPAWFPELYAEGVHGGWRLAGLMNHVELKPNAQSVNIPTITGAESMTPVPQGGGPVGSQDFTTGSTSNPVITIAGNVDLSVQLYEQVQKNGGGNFDQVLAPELQAAYNEAVETALWTGQGGANGNARGILTALSEAPSSHQVSGTAITTVGAFWTPLGQVMAAVGNDRRKPPQVWVMKTRRWAWMASSTDNNGRPLMVPGAGPYMPQEDTISGVNADILWGPFFGLPTILDDGVTSAGTTSSAAAADNVYCLRPSDMYLFENPTPRVLISDDSLSGTLQMRITMWNNVGFVVDRFPSGVGAVVNIPQPSGF